MDYDFREHPAFVEAEDIYSRFRSGGEDFFDASDLTLSADGRFAAFTAAYLADGMQRTGIGMVDLDQNIVRKVCCYAGSARKPRFRPGFSHFAYISMAPGDSRYGVGIADYDGRIILPDRRLPGSVESIDWSRDGGGLLAIVASLDATTAGREGAKALQSTVVAAEPWMPKVQTASADRWRRLWLIDPTGGVESPASPAGLSIWEAIWAGQDRIVVLSSDDPEESGWYRAELSLIATTGADVRTIYKPDTQIGKLASSPDGKFVAFIEGLASDRGVVAGDVRIMDIERQKISRVGLSFDATNLSWESGNSLLITGISGLSTIIGTYEVDRNRFDQRWQDWEISGSGALPQAESLGRNGDALMITEGYGADPALTKFSAGGSSNIATINRRYNDLVKSSFEVQPTRWPSADGLEIDGWLLLPARRPVSALVSHIHGGPSSLWRSRCLARNSAASLMLLNRGAALLLPNPRGSIGRGQRFAEKVLGDPGGGDAQDILAGIKWASDIVAQPSPKVGVWGGSYGGYLAAWLVTQSPEIAAAVVVAPVINRVSQRLTAGHGAFLDMLTASHFSDLGGTYYSRSPIAHAAKVTSPTLLIAGALDRCTPPGEAEQFFNAIRGRTETALVIYPDEGHGFTGQRSSIDYAARTVAWFEKHLQLPALTPGGTVNA